MPTRRSPQRSPSSPKERSPKGPSKNDPLDNLEQKLEVLQGQLEVIHDTITITKSSYISKNEFKSFFRLALLILILAVIASSA